MPQCPHYKTHQSPKDVCGWCGAPFVDPKSGAGRGSDTTGAAARNSRPTSCDLIGDPNFDPKGDDELSV